MKVIGAEHTHSDNPQVTCRKIGCDDPYDRTPATSYVLKVTDDLIARSENALLYRTYHGSYFAVCVCGKMLGLKITREIAEQSWCDHWTAMPFCHDPRL